MIKLLRNSADNWHPLQIVEKLLVASVADADVFVRRSIFSSLHENEGFDEYLAQADSLISVFAALNDEVSGNVEL